MTSSRPTRRLASALLLSLTPRPSLAESADPCRPPSPTEPCTAVSTWSDLTTALADGAAADGRVVLCPFPNPVTPASHYTVRDPIEILCRKSSESDSCTISGGTGYHFVIKSSDVTIRGLTFENSSRSAIATAYYSERVHVCSCTFDDCSHDGSSGGAIKINKYCDVTVDGCEFRNCSAKNGGAIWSNLSGLTVRDSSFVSNSAQYGGAVRSSSGHITLEGSTFTDNASSSSGPAVRLSSLDDQYYHDGGGNVGSNNIDSDGDECNGFYASSSCQTFDAPDFYLPDSDPTLDGHGIAMGYRSCSACGAPSPDGWGPADWVSRWADHSANLTSAFQVDPGDPRAVMRGSGSVSTSLGDGTLVFRDSPRFYVGSDPPAAGWENVEFTAYGKYVSENDLDPSYSGLTLAARSGHFSYKDDGCDAATYYARIYKGTGELGFVKEYYHDAGTTGTVYADSVRAPFFDGGIPPGAWIGMKFVVYTIPGTPGDVRLELYVDSSDGMNGGRWLLAHSYTDREGKWLANEPVPMECIDVADGKTILGPRAHCFLRASGYDMGTEVHWKKASIRNIDPVLL